MKYTLRDDVSFGKVLQKDGVDTFCPHQAPIPNGDRLLRMPCSSLCPHAKLEFSDRCNLYLVGCGSSVVPFHIEKT
jgi:hypothetical protein